MKFEIFEDFKGRRVFRVIHTTPILHKTPEVDIKTYTTLKMKNGAFSDLVIFFLHHKRILQESLI